ncbi:MAG: hypothetical protein ACKVT2_07805 [Saprospiraceae bacterium]
MKHTFFQCPVSYYSKFTFRSFLNNLSTISMALVLVLFAIGCRPPDNVTPGEDFCSAGANVLLVDDDNIPTQVKNKIYERPPAFVGVGHPDYNPNLPIVIIPFQFATQFPFNTSVTTDVIRHDFFSTGTGSVKDYFFENSWGQFNIREGFIANGVWLQEDPEFYNPGLPNTDWTTNPVLKTEVCQNSNVDWPSLDVNGDHVISYREAVICLMPAIGNGGANRPDVITISTNSGNYTIYSRFVFFDCKRNDDLSKGTDDIRYNYGTIWHELCHGMFGLTPDRYGVSGICGSGKVGKYDIMSNNCSRILMTIYDKMKLGWIRPRILGEGTTGQCYSIQASASTPAALVVLPNTSDPQGNEYWIIENRFIGASARNFDSGLPESGLAIWYVNEETDQIALVDARMWDQDPLNILYNPSDSQRGALFKYDPAAAITEKLLITANNRGRRFISYISNPGHTMYLNL